MRSCVDTRIASRSYSTPFLQQTETVWGLPRIGQATDLLISRDRNSMNSILTHFVFLSSDCSEPNSFSSVVDYYESRCFRSAQLTRINSISAIPVHAYISSVNYIEENIMLGILSGGQFRYYNFVNKYCCPAIEMSRKYSVYRTSQHLITNRVNVKLHTILL